MIQYYKTTIATIVGNITLIGSEKGMYAILWETDNPKRVKLPAQLQNVTNYEIFIETEKQLSEYFAGKRKIFDLQIDTEYGTPFQKKVWQALNEIPYGETRTYAEQAHLINNPKAIRAVGTANGKNPVSILCPCHRVIGKNGTLTGFAGGLVVKQRLLDLEKNFK